MNIFNSLGSNYNFGFVLKALFANNKPSHSSNLRSFLEKKYHGKAILVYKGREAIGLALEILDLPKGSVVAINGFTCFAVYKAVQTTGYEPICLDLDNNFDLNFSAQVLSKAIKQNPKIKVVIVQNTLGYPCYIEKIAKTCHENDLILIEDLAHCVGTKYKNGEEAGTIGDFVVLSFRQDKIIDAVSGGSLIIRNKKYQNYYSSSEVSDSKRSREVFTSDSSRLTSFARTISISTDSNLRPKQQLLDRLYPLFTFKIRKTYKIGLGKLIHFTLKKLNLLSKPMNESFYDKYDLPNWYAYLALDGLNKLTKNLEHRKKIAAIYNSILNKKICSKSIGENIKLSSNLRFPIFVENRKSLIDYLKKQGVYISDIWYDSVDEAITNAKTISDRILNLPTHINVREIDAKNIAQKINHYYSSSEVSPKADESRSLSTGSSRLSLDKLGIARTITSKEVWESFLSSHPEANFLQSWYWGEFYENLGNKIQRTGFYSNKRLVGVMLSIVEDAKRGRYLTVPGGPIIDWTKSDLIECFVEKIKEIAKSQSCIFVRVRPQLVSDEFSKNLFKKNGFINAPMHLHAELTSQLDIAKAEETLLSQMRKTTRYEIKKAIKQGIKITKSTDTSKILEFYDLQIETSKRQKFVPFSLKFLQEQFKVFANNGKALLFKAQINNRLLAEAFIIYYGREAVYHYGASTLEERNYPGNYLIQWEAILEAKRKGMQRYNFWGVSPIDKPNHRFYGLSLFKRGFGGQDVEYLHAQDLIINYPKYLINYAVENIRKKIRNV
jgi:lipid II:glycine glycyltransferase (peptidoglycan interpeptide bridge formation enzyme)/dTDP-4-amino-4,6-dideoxygalactose transaminase